MFRLQYLFATINKISKLVSQQWRQLSGLGAGIVVTEGGVKIEEN